MKKPLKPNNLKADISTDNIAPKVDVFFSIIKQTMQLYKLVQITIAEDGSSKTEVLHTDIPPIVYGKLLGKIQQQGFKSHDST